MTGVGTDSPRDFREFVVDTRKRIVALERRQSGSGSGGGGGGDGGGSDFAAGFIAPYAGANPPVGWLMCDGAAFSPTAFPELYAAIGVTYGGTAAAPLLPNLKGRIPVGKDAAQTEFDVLGETGGAKTVALTSAQLASHQHPLSYNGGNIAYSEAGGANRYTVGFGATRPGNGDVMSGWQADKTSNVNGDPHNNLQPYLTLNYIIATASGNGAGGGAATTPLPPPAMTTRSGSSTITATTWTAIPNYTPITLVLSRPAWVDISFGAWMAHTGTVGDVRAGVALSGAITLGPQYTQNSPDAWGTVMIRDGNIGAGSDLMTLRKLVLVPAGTTVFTPQAYNTGVVGTTGVNYGTLTVTPLAWDGTPGAVVAPPNVALPSSIVVTGSGATYNIDSKGNINFSNCATITINGVFLSDSKSYDVDYDLGMTASGGPIIQFTTAGVPFTAVANYVNQRTYSAGTTAAQGSMVDTTGQVNPAPVGGMGHIGHLRVVRPATANYTDWFGDNASRGGSNPIGQASVSGYVSTGSVFDGILLWPNTGLLSGSIRFRKLFD